jgi:peroxiredoxin
VRADIQLGAAFPDYELPDQTGHKYRLSELQQNDPLILHLARGDF